MNEREASLYFLSFIEKPCMPGGSSIISIGRNEELLEISSGH